MSFFQRIKNIFSDGDQNPGENQSFIRVLQVMQEDADFKNQVMKIVELDSFSRASLLNSIIHEIRLKNAPKEHILVFEYLMDDRICEQVKKILRE